MSTYLPYFLFFLVVLWFVRVIIRMWRIFFNDKRKIERGILSEWRDAKPYRRHVGDETDLTIDDYINARH